MLYKHVKLCVALAILFFLFSFRETSATPNYGRKYSLPCAGCHTVVPRLNETGFNFRAAGYRMPDEIGKPIPTFNLGDYFSGRSQVTIQNVNSTPIAGPSTSNTAWTSNGVELWVFNGAFTKNFSAITEVDVSPNSVPSLSGNFKYATGEESGFFTARVGIFHPYDGYGASDRGIGNGNPLMVSTSSANVGVAKSFTLTGFSELGLDAGYTLGRTSLHATLYNGIFSSTDGKTLNPAVGGGFTKSKDLPSTNSYDLQIFASQVLTDNGGGISGVLYLGQMDLPTGLTTPKTVDSLWWTNKFNRWAIFASYPILRGLILAGYESGVDNTFVKANLAKGDDFKSGGYFIGAEYSPMSLVGFGLRYDQFDPAKDIDNNEINQIALFGNYSFGDGFQIVAQYAMKTTKIGSASQKDNTIRLTLGFIQ